MFKRTICGLIMALLGVNLLLAGPVAAQPLAELEMQVPQGGLTLRQAQRLALQNSPRIEQALARIEAAQAQVDQARSGWLPRLKAYADYRLQDSTQQPDWQPELRINDSFKGLSGGLSANWLVFDGFARRARILAADYARAASQHTLDESRRLLAEAVANTFYQAQLAAEQMLVARQNRAFNRTLEEDADKRWQVGSIPEAEKLNFSVKALQAESDYLQAAERFALVTTALAELMALPEARLPEELYPVSSRRQLILGTEPDYRQEVTYALKRRADLKALQASLQSLTEKSEEEKGSFWPQVMLGGRVDYSYLDGVGTIDQEEHDEYVGLNLTWDLYQGGQRRAKLREIEKQKVELRQQLRQARLSLQAEIRQAIARVTTAKTIYQRQRRSLTLTERIREHTAKAYRAGVATLTRLNEAQTDLVRAAAATGASRIRYRLTLAQLEAVTGRVLEDLN